MITIDIGKNGRLGNQMFQYASLMGIASKQNLKYGIDYSLDDGISWKNFSDDEKKNQTTLVLPKAFNNLSAENHSPLPKTISEPHYHFDPKLFNIGDNVNLHGYFQSEKYFKHIEDKIRHEFTFRDDIVSYASSYLENKRQYETVSIHVRRGDYVNLPHHGLCDVKYYIDAIQKFSDRSFNFIVVTDDIPWAKSTFVGSDNFFISDTRNQFTDLCIMSLCDHNIIANSSFSWWGSWLNKNPDKIVIAPSVWFRDKLSSHDTKDLYISTWQIL